MNTTPPIVGVPCLPSLLASPMDRIGWPALSAVNTRIATGVPNREMMNATAAATMTALTGKLPQDPVDRADSPSRDHQSRDTSLPPDSKRSSPGPHGAQDSPTPGVGPKDMTR